MSQLPSERSQAVTLSVEQEALLQTIADYMSGAVPLPTGGATEVTAAAILASIGAAGDVAGANTLMGQLKQIAINTTPVL